MSIPQFKDKYSQNSVFTIKNALDYKKIKSNTLFQHPPLIAILCYQNIIPEYVLKHYKIRKIDCLFGEMYLLKDTAEKVAVVGKFGIGAPVVSILIEELKFYGIKKIITLGFAGALQKYLDIGDIVICDKAIRDEGTSHHYLKSEKYAFSSQNLLQIIIAYFDQLHQKYFLGTSWTTDAPFRETLPEITQYQNEGVLTVDMESAALFAIGKYLDVDVSSLFVVSDSLAESIWQSNENNKNLNTKLINIFNYLIILCTKENFV